MATGLYSSPYDYGNQKIEIRSPVGRFETIDISLQVVEFSFFENVATPYVTGNIVISDSSNMYNHVNFIGQEAIDFIINDVNDKTFLKKSFVITGVERYKKGNDSVAYIVLNFTEEHQLTSEITRFSKTYQGKIETIISNIISENLNKQVEVEASFQNAIRYLAPYTMSPIEMSKMLAGRITTAKGSPFYLYSSLAEESLRLQSLESMLADSLYPSLEFMYISPTSVHESDLDTLGTILLAMSMSKNENVIGLMRTNVFGSQHLWLDTNKTISTELRHRFDQSVNDLPRINGTTNYDFDFAVNSKAYHQGVSSMCSYVTTTGLFDNVNSLHEETVSDNHQKKIQSKSFKSLIGKTQMDVTIPGYHFMKSPTRILGKMIRMYVPKNIVPTDEANVSRNSLADKKLTGKYLVFAARHVFKNGKYHVTTNVSKYDNLNNLSKERLNVV